MVRIEAQLRIDPMSHSVIRQTFGFFVLFMLALAFYSIKFDNGTRDVIQ